MLELLAAKGAMYGLQLVSGSRGRLKRGTIYVTLGRMEEKGYLTSRPDDEPSETGGLPRRLYEPTALGREVLKVWTTAALRLQPRFA